MEAKKKTAKKTAKRGRPPKNTEAEKPSQEEKSSETVEVESVPKETSKEKVNWIRDSFGEIDWKAMVPDEFIILNKFELAKKGIEVDDLTDDEVDDIKKKASDRDLIILLGGFKFLAHLRGMVGGHGRCDYVSDGQNYVNCRYTVDFAERKDLDLPAMSFSAVANASFENVGKDFSIYLETMAENRAFCRAVRMGLNINIVSQEEIDERKEYQVSQVPEDAVESLKNLMDKKGVDFETFKKGVDSKYKLFDGESLNWESWADISYPQALVMLKEIAVGK